LLALQNKSTTYLPNKKPAPLFEKLNNLLFLSGSDHNKSDAKLCFLKSHGLFIALIYEILTIKGDNPPCIHKMRSEISPAIGI
jgi:hypothetical protein